MTSNLTVDAYCANTGGHTRNANISRLLFIYLHVLFIYVITQRRRHSCYLRAYCYV